MSYQNKQLELIELIEESFRHGKSPSTIVEPVSDYINDDRICLTSVFFAPHELEEKIIEKVINPLKEISPNQYYYVRGSFHITLNNIRTIADPPSFDGNDIEKAKQIFRRVISKYQSFTFDIKRLIELPTSLAITAFSDETLGNIALEIRRELKKVRVPDNKVYASKDIVIGNITISRYTNVPNLEFQKKIKQLKEVEIGSFEAEKVALITTNAICCPSKTKIIEEYELNKK